MIFDTHSHIYLWELEGKNDKIVQSFIDAWWKYFTTIWVDIETSKKAIEISKKYEWNWIATIWIHPCYVMNQERSVSENYEELKKLYNQNKAFVKGIWEAGYDNFHLSKTETEKEKKLQEEYFKMQIKLAEELNLPLIIHTRNAKEETLKTLKETWFKKFVIHCFSEDLEFAEKCMELSDECIFAFGWIATYPNAKEVRKAALNLPLDKIVLETDSPYLTPQKVRWQINEPKNTKLILDFFVENRIENKQEIEKVFFNNSINFFNLK